MSIWSHMVLFAEKVDAPPGIITGVKADNATLMNVFNIALALAGAIAVAFIVFGGIKFMLSRGEPNETKAARDTILYAAIGIVVVVVSFILVNFVIGKF